MISDLLEVGDNVIVTIPEDNRSWGYNPVPDGSVGKVTGFGEISYSHTQSFGQEPGVYENKCWVDISFKDGSTHNISNCFLEMKDKKEYDKRLKVFRKRQEEEGYYFGDKNKLRDLPETPFWEGDFVHAKQRGQLIVVTDANVFDSSGNVAKEHVDIDTFVVCRIDYNWLGRFCNDGVTPYPAYSISSSMSGGWSTSCREDEMTLVARGNVWKYYHGEPITFKDLKEEADFYRMIGKTKEVRNPKSMLYSWILEEALEAIKKGIAHGFTMGGSFFCTDQNRISVLRFENEEVGKRVALATLEGFNI